MSKISYIGQIIGTREIIQKAINNILEDYYS